MIEEPLPDIIDPNEFTPRLFALLSNSLVWRESRLLREAFGLGTNDWRMLSAVATEPGIATNTAAAFLGMNKAIISKSVNTLLQRGLVVDTDGRRGTRHLYLTEAGAEMHDKMRPISMGGQEIITAGMSPEEVRALNATLRQMLDRIRRNQP